ncbi:MAG TPA: YajQ family cyclic di-GMP-binding protein [Terriglobales bacterium]|nr:YajQ family cyclic di-GMP-binding protein [Terriglobales bacterium]
MPENSFDIVSKIDLQEVSNAIQQALKEISTRFDLKDSKSTIALDGKDAILLQSIDEFKLKAVNDVFQQKLVKRGVPLKGLTYSAVESALGGAAKQRITMQQGIPVEKAREMVKVIKNSKKKVQASIQGDLVRVSGKDRDTLQEIIALLRQQDFGIDMQFTNYRSN